jgi:hypothetical protein
MLNRHFQHSRQLRMTIRRVPQRANYRPIQFALQLLVVPVNLFPLRPVRRGIGRQAATHGIDSKRKKLIEAGMERLQPEGTLREQIPIEGFYVSNVKDNPVPFGDRPPVQRILAHDAEHFIRAFARIYQAGMKVMPDADSTSRGFHA